jgi:hypothetical protein
MGKITLALESLAVESFATTPGEGTGGTVVAHQLETFRTACVQVSCADTCIQTCANTCLNTCGTCNASCYDTCAVSCFGTCQTACGGCGYMSQPPAFYSCRFC